ncbi:hypothetical protein DRH13_02835 [Candidatus Woesebacteria bacterium]|nr:MAG: hypothetical protein DRH13_02835 [Candidatus Woesebacteria bacterium]
MKEFTMVIPTYWARDESEEKGEKIIFDHPTALKEEGTLGRLLESLSIFKQVPGKIVAISVANECGIAGEVKDKVDQIIEPYQSRYDITNLGQITLEKIKGWLADKGVSGNALELVNLNNYAAVRNICALAGICNGSKYTIFIDDDEVFTDPDFLKKIEENMGRVIAGEEIDALAGYYLQPNTYRLDESKVPKWRAPWWNNTVVMNTAFEKIIGQGPRLKPTPFVFGGNMTVSLGVLKKVPFDPQITRGEDIDFLLNLRIHGITFYIDRELAIKHLPPASAQEAWKKVREDAIRFMYERKKVRDYAELTLEELQPYPGMFLGDDLEERIIKTNELLKREYESKHDEERIKECEKTIAMTEENLWGQIDTRAWLNQITAHWQEVAMAAEGLGIPK